MTGAPEHESLLLFLQPNSSVETCCQGCCAHRGEHLTESSTPYTGTLALRASVAGSMYVLTGYVLAKTYSDIQEWKEVQETKGDGGLPP